jgi:quercetin dioxygenase-like cupin family protein
MIAQPSATPPATDAGVSGIGGFAPVASLPSPAVLGVSRVTLEPGAVLHSDASDPSTSLLYVESGDLVLRVNAPIAVVRAGTAADPGAPIPQEAVAANSEIALRPGDAFIGPPHVEGDLRNHGQAPAVLLLAIVLPTR